MFGYATKSNKGLLDFIHGGGEGKKMHFYIFGMVHNSRQNGGGVGGGA